MPGQTLVGEFAGGESAGFVIRSGAATKRMASRATGALVTFNRFARTAALFALATLSMTGADAWHAILHAQGKLDARYTASLSGLPVGRGAWVVDIADDHFSAAASGSTAGLMQIFASGSGQSMARGSIVGGQLVPASYVSSIATDKKYDDVRMAISAGGVKEYVAEPPSTPAPDRVPLTEAHRRGVVDPMTGSLFRVPGTGNPLVPEACPRKVAVFDGRMRYDLHLSFKRMENVKAEPGYQGPVVVCSLQFSPIAGHIPDRAAIKYLAELRTMEMWLAPIAGTRVLVPYRATVPTPIGVGVLQATQFVSTALPAKPGPAAKTQ
jgi:hypothetical protein